MELAIDIGNNYSKLAVFEGEEMVYSDRWKKFRQDRLKKAYKKFSIERAIISDVSGKALPVEKFIKKRSAVVKFSPDTPVPLKNLYKTPKTLGRDRIAAVTGARHFYPKGSLLVIDAGTCITYDFVNYKNEYLGGGISPGMQIRFRSLKHYTGKLPLVKRQDIDYLVGGSTEESILSGVINGMAAEINGVIDRYRKDFPKVQVLVTGGDGPFFESYVKSDIFAVPNLVLYGLHKILLYNVPPLR